MRPNVRAHLHRRNSRSPQRPDREACPARFFLAILHRQGQVRFRTGLVDRVQRYEKGEMRAEGKNYALDYFCHPFDFVASRVSLELHAWWLYSHPAPHCTRRSGNRVSRTAKSIVKPCVLSVSQCKPRFP